MLDPDIAAFVADSDRFFPADTATRSIAEQRRLYESYAAAFALRPSPGVIREDGGIALPDRVIRLRRYRPPGAARGTVLFAHGGGFTLGSLESHDEIAARIAARTGADVVAVDYRLAPEHPCPAAVDDVRAALDAVLACATPWADLAAGPLVLSGDSAGATLVTAASRHAVDEVAGLALLYPMLGFEPTPPARDEEANAPMLTLAEVRAFRDAFLGGREPEPGTFALDAPPPERTPPVFLLAAEHDPLRDDAVAYAARLREAGRESEWLVGQGLAHGFVRAVDRSAVAAEAFEALLAFVRGRLAG